MWKKAMRSLDVRRRRREEELVRQGRCPDCRQRVDEPANNRCNMPWVGRLGYHGALRPLFRQPHPTLVELVSEERPSV